MGEGDKRRARRSARFDSRELAQLSKKHVRTEREWDERVAAGTQQVPIAQLASRTVTVDDPLTTSLLAEVARRSKTIDVSPDQIDEVRDLEPGEAAAPAEPGEPGAGERDPAGPTDDPL
jgi:hypothetical protein